MHHVCAALVTTLCSRETATVVLLACLPAQVWCEENYLGDLVFFTSLLEDHASSEHIPSRDLLVG